MPTPETHIALDRETIADILKIKHADEMTEEQVYDRLGSLLEVAKEADESSFEDESVDLVRIRHDDHPRVAIITDDGDEPYALVTLKRPFMHAKEEITELRIYELTVSGIDAVAKAKKGDKIAETVARACKRTRNELRRMRGSDLKTCMAAHSFLDERD